MTIGFRWALTLLFVLMLLVPGSPCWAGRRINVLIGGEVFHLQVAETPQDFSHGLMNRRWLKANQGMLFPFKAPQKAAFWMKNCLLSLDIIFIRQGKVLNIAENVPPCDSMPCPVYTSRGPVDTVIELNAGRSRALHLKPGSEINTPE